MQTNSNSEIQIIGESYNLIKVYEGIIRIKFDCSNNSKRGKKTCVLSFLSQLNESLLNAGISKALLSLKSIKSIKLQQQQASCTKQARKSSEDTHFTGYARFEKVWAR